MKKGHWMLAMTCFVVAFYSFIFISDTMASRRDRQKISAENAQVLQSLKQKEETAQKNLLAHPVLFDALSSLFLTALLAGVYLDGRLLSRLRQGRSWIEGPAEKAKVCWGGKEVAGGFVFLLFAEALLFLRLEVSHRWAPFGPQASEMLLFVSSLLRDVLVVVFIWMLIKARHGLGFRELGMRFERVGQHLRTGFLGYLAVLPPLLLTFGLLGAVLDLFSVEPAPQNVVQVFLKDSTSAYLVPLTVFVALVGPALEEIFFRGFAYAGLRKRFGVWPSACIASAAFAALHMNAVAFFPIFVLGMFLAYLYESSGSLIPSITAHMLHNAIMVALTLGFKGLSA